MEKLSVVIISYNEEKDIGRCIDSVKGVADEILILDSNSTDRTVEIAERLGAVVKKQDFRGYVQQISMAVDMAAYDFVLNIDADEALDPVLIASVLKAKENFSSRAYKMNRLSNYCGKFIRHGSWYPDTKIRLFDRRIAAWGGINPHSKVILKDNLTAEHLKGDILHYSYYTISEHVAQNNKFSSISAETMHAQGEKTSLFKMMINPPWAFFLGYILRLGFLDGLFGFVIAVQIAHLTFLKHLKLYLLNRSAK